MNKIRNKKSYFNILSSIVQFVTHYYSENYKKRHLMGFFDWLKKVFSRLQFIFSSIQKYDKKAFLICDNWIIMDIEHVTFIKLKLTN